MLAGVRESSDGDPGPVAGAVIDRGLRAGQTDADQSLLFTLWSWWPYRLNGSEFRWSRYERMSLVSQHFPVRRRILFDA